MYFPGKTQPNNSFASMQRTFYPKYLSYYGDGSGRDQQVIMANGGLTREPKKGLGHHGVHFNRYNSNVMKKASPSPNREALTFYYQSDGSGRDSYVLMDNGGLRREFSRHNKPSEALFRCSLRSSEKSPVKYLRDPVTDSADITTYRNWLDGRGQAVARKHNKIQKALIQRLTQSRSSAHNIIRIVGSNEEQQSRNFG